MRARLVQVRQIDGQSTARLDARALADYLTRQRTPRQVLPTERPFGRVARILAESILMHQIPVVQQAHHAHVRHAHIMPTGRANAQRARQYRRAHRRGVIQHALPTQHKATLVRLQRGCTGSRVIARYLGPRQFQAGHLVIANALVLRRGKTRIRNGHRPSERRYVDLLGQLAGNRVIQVRHPRHQTTCPLSQMMNRRPHHKASLLSCDAL